jgi:hypothetical protein
MWGMAAGDGDKNGQVNLGDYTIWFAAAGTKGYLNADYNLGGQINNPDKNDEWLGNLLIRDQIPD